MNEHNPDDAILCDICNAHGGGTDPREPWDRKDNKNNPKPTWRCEVCVKAVKDATEQRLGSLYPSVTFPTKEAYQEYQRSLKSIGFHTIHTGPTNKNVPPEEPVKTQPYI